MNSTSCAAISLLIVSLAASAAENEREGDYWYVQTSAYTKHWTHDPDHNNHQELVGIERIYTDGLLWGAATFKNSFYQRSFTTPIWARSGSTSATRCTSSSVPG